MQNAMIQQLVGVMLIYESRLTVITNFLNTP